MVLRRKGGKGGFVMWGLGSWRRGGWSCRRNCECGGLCVVWSLCWIETWGDENGQGSCSRYNFTTSCLPYTTILSDLSNSTYPHIHIPSPPGIVNIPFAPSPKPQRQISNTDSHSRTNTELYPPPLLLHQLEVGYLGFLRTLVRLHSCLLAYSIK